MSGLIQYVVPVDTPAASIFDAYDVFALPDVFAETLAAGDTQNIYLPAYVRLQPKKKENSILSRAVGGIMQGHFFDLEKTRRIAVEYIPDKRETDMVNIYDVYDALNEACARKVPLVWYEDVDEYPTEFINVMVEKIRDMKRMKESHWFRFEVDLIEMSEIQMPAVPGFVPL
jgi:hypothetical protein